ncbi:hypothetical protein BJX70DRAFT_395735 [Aspergillus crustosus]
MPLRKIAYGGETQDWTNFDAVNDTSNAGFQALTVGGGALVDAIPLLNRLPWFLAPWKTQAELFFQRSLAALAANAFKALKREPENWTQMIYHLKQAEGMS